MTLPSFTATEYIAILITAIVCLTVVLTVGDNAQSRNQELYADLAVQDLRMLN